LATAVKFNPNFAPLLMLFNIYTSNPGRAFFAPGKEVVIEAHP
jgi:hypothetical protein